MEESLYQIVTAAASYNFLNIKKSAQDALDLLALQQGLMRDPADELREKCLKVVQLCLETKRSKFASLSICCCHRLLRDDRFHSNFEPQDDSKWLLGQLLQATSSFSQQTDDAQVDILKIFLNVACGNVWNMNGRLIIAVLSLCSEAFESGNAAVRTGAQAAACQTLRSFVSQLEEERTSEDTEASTFNEILPIMQYICSSIDSSESSGRCEHGVLFLLECLLTLASTLPQSVSLNPHLRMFIWQKMAPALISVLGTPKVDKYIISRGVPDSEWGRGSGYLAAAPSFTSLHARAVYSISAELVRLVGPVLTLRPMLESLFHRILLYPAPAYRLDALRATAELLRNPLRLLDIAGPLVFPDEQPCDMALIRLMMDSIDECRKGDLPLMAEAVSCASALLNALEELCRGSCLPNKAVKKILLLWPTMLNCEYSGPAYYQSAVRLPSAYQHQIQMEQEAVKNRSGEESDSSGIGQKSDCSGDTEGPESVEQDLDEAAVERDLGQDRLEKVPRTLGLEIVDFPIGLGDSDRQHARHFIGALHDLLAALKPMWCSTQLDRAIQTFASQYCQGVVRDQPITEWGIIVNADGIYLTTLQALLLDLGLYKAGYYGAPEQTPHLTEDEFVQQVQNAGILVYLSGSWLREVYQAVVSGSLLQAHGYLPANSQTHSLINLLTDIGGLGSRQRGSEMLWECRRVESPNLTTEPSPEVAAGIRLARLLLTCCWTSLLRILAVPLSYKAVRGKRRQQILRDAITCSLESLQGAARLCSLLGVQDRCDLILELLCGGASSSCGTLPRRLLSGRDGAPRLTAPTSLSLELILQQGLELGSHCSDCWPHVFRSVLFVRRMERAVFNAAGGRDVAVTPPGFQGQEVINEDDDVVDVYSFLRSSSSELMVSRYVKTSGCADTLTPVQTASVVTLLSYMAVELTTDAAYKLNLQAFEAFARALCAASRNQLFPPLKKRNTGLRSAPSWIQKWLPPPNSPGVDTYLLDLVGDLMVKCARSCRPLAHVMRLWAVIGPHLTEAACHSDPSVSKKAVELIEAVISSHMKQESELPYFHFNEALFKPFENLLCLELCDGDVQDQIVASICEFVEGSAGDVRSGWRALFGALRAVPTTAAVASATFLDVFALFLDTKSPLVFCTAAVDCILCLLKHIRSSCPTRRAACVHFLQRCEDVLSAVHAMPQAVVFQAAHRIHVSDGLLVEPEPGSPRLVKFDNIPTDLQHLPYFSYSELSLARDEIKLSLDSIDRPSGVLRVWFLLLEGLYSAAIAADASSQPALLDATFGDVMSLIGRPDHQFGILCINRMLLPATQSWLRQAWRESVTDLSGPKQALGLLSDLTVTLFKDLHGDEALQPELTLTLKELFLLLVECSPQPSMSSTPTSCFRHIIMNVGHLFSRAQWRIAVLSLRRAFELTLIPLRQILMAFSPGSHSFYGDYDQVKVAARRDGTSYDILQLKHLSQQVFLLEGQREGLTTDADHEAVGERNYTFLLNPSTDPNNADVQRVSVRMLVCSLLTHQALLQIVAGALLQGSSHVVPSLVNVLLSTESSRSPTSKLPGILGYMSKDDVLLLLDCLDLAYQSALQFDARPGLKFLVQKVAGLERAANLYGQAGAAWAVKVVVLFELCLHHCKEGNVSPDQVKEILQNPTNDSDVRTFITRLRQNFEELCDTYIDVVLDNDGAHSAIDKAADQSILFLNACQDEQISRVQRRRSESDGIPLQTDMIKEIERRPAFHFSDFVETISASSTSDSELEFADGCDDEVVSRPTSEMKNNESFVEDEKDRGTDYKGENLQTIHVESLTDSLDDNDSGAVDNDRNESKRIHIERKDCSDTKDSPLSDSSFPTGEKLNDKIDKAGEENINDEDGSLGDEPIGTPEPDTLSAALDEYKRRKKKQSHPRLNPFDPKKSENQQVSSIPPEIEVQRRNSFLKDSEAHRRVWAEMLGAVFNLLSQLTDDEFRTILPILFNGIRRLTAHVSDAGLKEAVSELFSRVALVYGFGGLAG